MGRLDALTVWMVEESGGGRVESPAAVGEEAGTGYSYGGGVDEAGTYSEGVWKVTCSSTDDAVAALTAVE